MGREIESCGGEKRMKKHQKQKHASLGGRHVGQWTSSTCRRCYPTMSSSCGGAVVSFVFFLYPFLHLLILISSQILRSHPNQLLYTRLYLITTHNYTRACASHPAFIFLSNFYHLYNYLINLNTIKEGIRVYVIFALFPIFFFIKFR